MMTQGTRVTLADRGQLNRAWFGEIGTVLEIVSRPWGTYAMVLYDRFRSAGAFTYLVSDLVEVTR